MSVLILNQTKEVDDHMKLLTGQAAEALQKRDLEFRNYTDSPHIDRVRNNYKLNHENQTLDFVLEKKAKVLKLDKVKMTIWEAAELIDTLVDESDPDTALGQIEHLLQTAEALREAFPEQDWLHLVGFIHDLGKVIGTPALYNDPQWCVVGDTFPVGCAHAPEIVFHELFANNADTKNPKYNTKYGIYEPNCGLDNVHFSFGHDEYMYQVCVQNQSTLPPEALYIVRYHSFYSWHTHGAYDHLCNDADRAAHQWVKTFQAFDLYSKTDERIDVAAVKPYYLALIDKYFGSHERKLNW